MKRKLESEPSIKAELELFFYLPTEIQLETARHLSSRDVLNHAQISKQHLRLFTPILNTRKFLHCVTRGQYDIVKEMLINNIQLIVEQGIVTDCSGRIFKNISGFEYTLWAKDKSMWTIMLDSLSKSEEKSIIIKKLYSQYKNVKINGVTFYLKDKQVTECHFDFENTIIKELRTQVNFLNDVNRDVTDKQWGNDVGGAQKLLPMHVVFEYCSDKLFHPLPDFTNPFKLLSVQAFYNWKTSKYENWFDKDSKLGVDFAIVKGWGGLPMGVPGYELPGWRIADLPRVDLIAMKELCKVRTNDFINLESQLEALARVDNQPQFTPDF